MPTIRVVVRFRPINSVERKQAEDNGWSGKDICPMYIDGRHLLEFDPADVSEEEKVGHQVRCWQKNVSVASQPRFAFDEILVWVQQQTAFQRIGLPVVNDALNGINGTIFAYGQTGSGKTYSMFGQEPLTDSNVEHLGVIPRCCAQIFTNLDSDASVDRYKIDCSFYEIYIHNAIRDLLHPAKKGDPPLKVRDGPWGVFVEHLKAETVSNLTDILGLIAVANSHRTTSSTKMNASSSRSHSVMSLIMKVQKKDGSRFKSQINFGDLAGSEKVAKSGATGQTLKEAQAINQSLTMLGNVIAALAKIGSGQKKAGSMVPFRDSALTHVLKDSLSGNCKTTLVTAASPHKFNLMETISTFRFGSRCKLVKTSAQKNVVLSAAQMRKMIDDLNKQIKRLKMQVLQGGGGGAMSAVGGMGVKITWPTDFDGWPQDENVCSTLSKQVDAQIKRVLEESVAANSDQVARLPYSIRMSEAGAARKVVIQFHADADDDEFDRDACLQLSKKLCSAIQKLNKNALEPALQNYARCVHFSEASSEELQHVIQQQSRQISALTEQCDDATQALHDKRREFDDLRQSEQSMQLQDLETASVGSGASASASRLLAMDHHHTANNGSSSPLPNVFDVAAAKMNGKLRQDSIFSNSSMQQLPSQQQQLRTSDLLSQLLYSKYEVLRIKRAHQLQQFRFLSEQQKMKQLRFVIARMQSEFMDLKAMSLVSKALINNSSNAAADGGGVDELVRTVSASFGADISQALVSSTLDEIKNDLDTGESSKQTPQDSVAKAMSLHRRISSLSDAARKNQKRRSSATSAHSTRSNRSGGGGGALQAYQFNRHKNNGVRGQMLKNNKQAAKFAVTSTRKLLKDVMGAVSNSSDRGGTTEEAPNVPLNDATKLWSEYDAKWILKWSTTDVAKWMKSIHNGRMRKYATQFTRKKVDGAKLLALTMPQLLDLGLIRAEANQVLAFTNSLPDEEDNDDDENDFDGFFNDLDDFDWNDEDDDDDFFGDEANDEADRDDWNDQQHEDDAYANGPKKTGRSDVRFYDDPTQRLTDLMVEQLTADEVRQIQKLPRIKDKNVDSAIWVNFQRVKEYYQQYSQVLITVVFGLLCNKIGLLNVNEWNALLAFVRSKSESEIAAHGSKSNAPAYFEDQSAPVHAFVNVAAVYEQHSETESGKLTSDGARVLVAGIRADEAADNLRDDEDAVLFFAGLNVAEMEQFMQRVPNTLWSLINAPMDLEFVYREIRKTCASQVTPEMLEQCLRELGANFVARGLVKKCVHEMEMTPTPTISLDVWIKKLFIKPHGVTQSSHASESVLHELLLLNDKLEAKYHTQLRSELLAMSSVGSDEEELMADYDHDEEKEVAWIDYFDSLNGLLLTVGQFGAGTKCRGLEKVPRQRFTASSTLRTKSGSRRQRLQLCTLNSSGAWTADYLTNKDSDDNDMHWIQVDLGKITTLFAVAIQGRADKDEWVSKAVLTVSDANRKDWRKVQLVGDSQGAMSCRDRNSVQVYMFARWIKARFVRINIYTYHNAPSVRWDLLFGDVNTEKIPHL